MSRSLNIITFKPQYVRHFRDLNLTWHEEYFYVEERDKELPNDRKKILSTKADIFLPNIRKKSSDVSLIRLSNTSHELGKMSIDPKFKGLKIGQQLLDVALDLAK